jgi:serine/threonine protein kinase
MPKYTCLPIVHALASFSADSTYHIVLEALEPGQLSLPSCRHQAPCHTHASCPVRQNALRKVAAQLLLALALLHDKMGYIHADLKPENILRCRNGIPLKFRANSSFTTINETKIDRPWKCGAYSED